MYWNQNITYYIFMDKTVHFLFISVYKQKHCHKSVKYFSI